MSIAIGIEARGGQGRGPAIVSRRRSAVWKAEHGTPRRAVAWLAVAASMIVAGGCGPSPAFEPEAAVPEGAVLVPNAAVGGVSCALESKLRSRLGPETRIRITNATAEPLSLFWLDYAGKRRGFGALEAGASAVKLTYAGHVWIAADASGRCAGAAVAVEGTAELRVGSAPLAPSSAAPTSGDRAATP